MTCSVRACSMRTHAFLSMTAQPQTIIHLLRDVHVAQGRHACDFAPKTCWGGRCVCSRRRCTCRHRRERGKHSQGAHEHGAVTAEARPPRGRAGRIRCWWQARPSCWRAGHRNADHPFRQEPQNDFRRLFRCLLTLRDSAGQDWPVLYEATLSCNQYHRRFSQGWRDFCRNRGVQMGDVIELRRRRLLDEHTLAVRVVKRGRSRPRRREILYSGGLHSS
jgi:hypothetical protein